MSGGTVSIAEMPSNSGHPLGPIQDSIVDAVYESVLDRDTALARDEESAWQLKQQVEGIIAEVLLVLGFHRPSVAEGDHGQALSRSIGRVRARDSVHPSTSLDAASLIFDIALPVLLLHLPLAARSAERSVAVSRALHRAIMGRVAPAAVGYVETLLNKLTDAQHEERLRISRQLHDHVAHNIAAALQRLALSQAAHETGNRGDDPLNMARELLQSALGQTRLVSVELRHVVGSDYLHEAVDKYVHLNPALAPLTRVSSLGTPEHLPVSTSEEIYVIAREALRNAAAHSNASRIRVQFQWTPGNVLIRIEDNGHGFDPGDVKPSSMGLLAMHERADAVGASLTVGRAALSGTVVELHIDHARGLV